MKIKTKTYSIYGKTYGLYKTRVEKICGLCFKTVCKGSYMLLLYDDSYCIECTKKKLYYFIVKEHERMRTLKCMLKEIACKKEKLERYNSLVRL